MKCKICGKTFNPTPKEPQSNGKSLTERFRQAQKNLGDADYRHILKGFGFKSISEIKEKDKAEEILKSMEDVTGTKEVFSGD